MFHSSSNNLDVYYENKSGHSFSESCPFAFNLLSFLVSRFKRFQQVDEIPCTCYSLLNIIKPMSDQMSFLSVLKIARN